jgi:outer membrane lipoprotein-sorting protein
MLLAFVPVCVIAQIVDLQPPISVTAVELQMQRLTALYAKKHPPGDDQAAQRAARAFLEHLRTSSPIAAEKLINGRMEDGELESRFDVYLRDRPELQGRVMGIGVGSPRERVAELMKKEHTVANDEAGRFALAEKFIERLAERSSLANDTLRNGKMSDEELNSRVAIFLSDLKAEAVAVSVDPSVAALEALVDTFIKANFGREGERVDAIAYQGAIEENGVAREFVIFRKRPNKFRMHFVKEGLVASVLSYDGKTAWRQVPGKEAQRISDAETAGLREIARFDPPIVGIREREAHIFRDDKTSKSTVTLRIREKDGSEYISVIDTETLLELSQRRGGTAEETRYRDYRKLGALNVAHTQEQWVDGSLRSVTRIEDVRLQPGLLDSFFNLPEKQSLGFMDYMGALIVIKERSAQQTSSANTTTGGKP